MKGVDAVIHMAAIPNPLGAPEHEVFRVNMASDWNVLEAAEIHGIRKVVKASSINAVGAVFSKRRVAPLYFPIDEEHPTRAEDSYSQSKWLGEEMADGFCRRREMQIASMRFHALMEESRQADLRTQGDTTTVDGRTAKEFWGWTDIGEAATACRLALETDWDRTRSVLHKRYRHGLDRTHRRGNCRGLSGSANPFAPARFCVCYQCRKSARGFEVGPAPNVASALVRETARRDIQSGASTNPTSSPDGFQPSGVTQEQS